MSTQDLREQVARLLFETERGKMSDVEWAIVWAEVSSKPSAHANMQRADTLLPLFASRERAAAEKAHTEAVEASMQATRDTPQTEPFTVSGFEARLSIAKIPNPYTVKESPNAE